MKVNILHHETKETKVRTFEKCINHILILCILLDEPLLYSDYLIALGTKSSVKHF
uniref:Ovule protein n=1 Tax=Heterorhabditis bacteriophora TaxID=37862 RepID=A0A1I7W8A2_HETBA